MKKLLFILMCVFLMLSATTGAFADTNKDMMQKEQDFIVLGSVKDIGENEAVITVDHVLGEEVSSMVGKDIVVSRFRYSYCEYHTPTEFNNPIISDNIVISLDSDGDMYVVKNGAYKVDSNEFSNCKILSHTDETSQACLNGLSELACFIRSNARVTEFSFDSTGRIYAVYPQTTEQCIRTVDNDGKAVADDVSEEPAPENSVINRDLPPVPSKNIGWIIPAGIFVLGALLGILVAYLSAKRKLH